MTDTNGTPKITFQEVERPSHTWSGRSVEKRYPLDAIMATAETGGAVRISVEVLTAHILRDVSAAGKHGKSKVPIAIASIRNALKTRGYAVEWNFNPTKTAVDIWCVPIGVEVPTE